jgi:hypothetical protein
MKRSIEGEKRRIEGLRLARLKQSYIDNMKKMGEKRRGINNPAYRKEVREKISNTVKKLHREGHYKKMNYGEKISKTLKSIGMSAIKKEYYINHPELRQQIGLKTKIYMKNPIIKEKHRESLKRAYAEGRIVSPFKNINRYGINNPMYGRECPHARGGYYNGTYFRSSWEVNMAKILDKNNIIWIYEPQRFFYENFTYLPDFYLPYYNLYLEVKGWLGRNKNDINKMNKFKESNRLLLINLEIYKNIMYGKSIFEYIVR